MKSGIVLVSIASIVGLRLCGSDEAPPPTTSAPPTSATAAVATHGGTVVVAGEKNIEVIAKADGVVEAWVPEPAADAQLTVHVRGADGQAHPVTMRHEASGHFTGRLEGTAPAPGPVEVVYVSGGNTVRGNVEAIAVIDVPGFDVNANAVAVAPPAHGGIVVAVEGQPVEVLAKGDGEIEAFFVAGANGAMAIQPAQATLVVEVMGSDRQMHPVTLQWDAATSSYKGELEGDLEIVPGAMEVVITADGRARRARGQIAGLHLGHDIGVRAHGQGRGRGNARVEVQGAGNQRVEVGGGTVRVGGAGGQGVVVGGGAGGGVRIGGGGAGGGIRIGGSVPPPPSARVEVRVETPRPPPPPRVRATGSVGVSAGGGVGIGN
jgi:hypothetical protein